LGGLGRVDTDRAKEVRSCCIAGAVVDVGVVAAEPNKWVHAEAWRTAGVDTDIEIEDRGCGLSLEGRKWSLS